MLSSHLNHGRLAGILFLFQDSCRFKNVLISLIGLVCCWLFLFSYLTFKQGHFFLFQLACWLAGWVAVVGVDGLSGKGLFSLQSTLLVWLTICFFLFSSSVVSSSATLYSLSLSLSLFFPPIWIFISCWRAGLPSSTFILFYFIFACFLTSAAGLLD